MAVKLFKPDLAMIKAQAELARKASETSNKKYSSGDSKFNWGNIEMGDNIIRPLPPTNSRGVLGRKISNHQFRYTDVKGVDNQRCLVATHDDVEGVQCMLCDAGDKLLATQPNLDIRGWHEPRTYYYIQAYDRKSDNPVAGIYRLTPFLYNWLTEKMESLLESGVDLTDIDQGVDIMITKKKEANKSGGGERIKYVPELWMLKGATPLHEDEGIKNAILESMIDLDKDIWKYPGDEALADFSKASSDVTKHYMTQLRKEESSKGKVDVSSVREEKPTVSSPAKDESPTPTVSSTDAAEVARQAVEAAKSASAPDTSTTPDPTPEPKPLSIVNDAAPAPTDKPACFAGAAKRKDGGVGYDETAEVCLSCPKELECEDVCGEMSA